MHALSLCSGIGGLELGIRLAGVHVERCLYVESDPYACAVLAARVAEGSLARGVVFPGDLHELRGSVGCGRFDIITAGFPCQPASCAGSRKGRDDERWIWPAIADLIAEAEPRYVFIENVRGLLTVDGGHAFREVLESLAACGLDARWGLFRASDVGAPHRRERVFILGVSDTERRQIRDEPWREGCERRAWLEPGREGATEPRDVGAEAVADADLAEREERRRPLAAQAEHAAARCGGAAVADADGWRREGERLAERAGERGARGRLALGHGGDGGLGWPPGPAEDEAWERWLAAGGPAGAVQGRLNAEFVEALMGFPIGWTDLGGPEGARRERLKCLGNAVVPQQAALAWEVLSSGG